VNGWQGARTEAARAEAARTDDLEKLAAELNGKDYKVTLFTAEGRRPCLQVANRRATVLNELIYAGPADDEAWWFWFGWAERITPVADIAAAARNIEQVLRAVDSR